MAEGGFGAWQFIKSVARRADRLGARLFSNESVTENPLFSSAVDKVRGSKGLFGRMHGGADLGNRYDDLVGNIADKKQLIRDFRANRQGDIDTAQGLINERRQAIADFVGDKGSDEFKTLRGSYQEAVGNYADIFKDHDRAVADISKMRVQQAKLMGEGLKSYMLGGNLSNIAAKHAVAGGLYMGGATALRYAKGGTFTTNSAGEKDIAGIPFY